MPEEATFQPVGQSELPMYGPRAILVCGYAAEEHPLFVKFVNSILGDISIVFVTSEHKNKKLGELVALPHNSGAGEKSDLRRAVIMSGLTEHEFHTLINSYRTGKLPTQLWATLTNMSEKWPISSLLNELAQERDEIQKMMRERRQAQAQAGDNDA
ncbi:DUF3783 domain-containing protein [candidate division KSB1 bacterium]|nr:DUF3783 domain-containing protein [candidate division KSB1 bacterium]